MISIFAAPDWVIKSHFHIVDQKTMGYRVSRRWIAGTVIFLWKTF